MYNRTLVHVATPLVPYCYLLSFYFPASEVIWSLSGQFHVPRWLPTSSTCRPPLEGIIQPWSGLGPCMERHTVPGSWCPQSSPELVRNVSCDSSQVCPTLSPGSSQLLTGTSWSLTHPLLAPSFPHSTPAPHHLPVFPGIMLQMTCAKCLSQGLFGRILG